MHTFYMVGNSVQRGLIAELLELEADIIKYSNIQFQ